MQLELIHTLVGWVGAQRLQGDYKGAIGCGSAKDGAGFIKGGLQDSLKLIDGVAIEDDEALGVEVVAHPQTVRVACHCVYVFWGWEASHST